jgi:outer membrane receptor protein involved in Fe transport
MCLCVVALTTGSPSFAASADQAQPASSAPIADQSELERNSAPLVVITGSRIPHTELTAVSPVTTVDGYEFKLQGATNSEELLNWLPQVNPSQGEFVTAAATGAATINLRGLGAVRTLVLVNGRRLMPGDPRFLAADINAIPTAIIQRVEVLTGGAAAVYGSDAVAGVVNFILETKVDGLKFEGQIGAFQHKNQNEFAQELLDRRQLPYPKGSLLDGRRENLSVGFGRSFLDNRAHVTLYAGYRRIEAVKQDQRDYSACPITARTVQQKPTAILECGGPIVSFPGNYFDNFGNVYQVTPDRTFVPGMTRFNSGQWNLIQRPDKRYTAGGFASFDLSKGLRPGKSDPRETSQTRKRSIATIRCCPLSKNR